MGHRLLDRVLHLLLLFVLRARNMLLILDFITSAGEVDHVLLTVSQVKKNSSRGLRYLLGSRPLDPLVEVVLGADELP